MFDDIETHNISIAGVIFLTYLFCVVISYFILSTPITALFDAFDDANTGAAEVEYDWIMPIIRSSFNLFFAGMMAVPMTWFIVWIFRREPGWRYERRF